MMYQEHTVIDGVLYGRGDPNGEFKPLTAEQIAAYLGAGNNQSLAWVMNLLAENERLREALTDIRDLARTGVAPDVFGMTEENWKTYKLNKIAGEANRALNRKDGE